MDTKQNDGVQHAFPRVVDDGVHVHVFPGMTLRDYFAAAALTGILANPRGFDPETDTPEVTAFAVYAFADAMLKAREGE